MAADIQTDYSRARGWSKEDRIVFHAMQLMSFSVPPKQSKKVQLP